jgi:hypothetical protein
MFQNRRTAVVVQVVNRWNTKKRIKSFARKTNNKIKLAIRITLEADAVVARR